ncbi:hypothetical protein [Pseudomonas syringae]|uniref:hypothetical protein n=1 Tax=Pseudomonas syringae TaxID=317 RepID=UPI0006CB3EAF|nr:hypothetical protein [Pseudomonas syringae]ALD99820.1 hypothetical protein PSYRMG_01105 [Pseudomonas syringae UMAF0158]MCK9732184.1 hypothetical protein [Pseudomonas syringae pv. syringae]
MGRLWATAKGFPLLELLDTDALMSSGEYFNTYDARKLDSAIVESLFYFAVSIFWRANVWDWGWEQDGYRRALGPYEKDFRDFLLTGKKLESALLVLSVNSDKETAAVMSFPTCSRSGEDKLHTFVLLGIRFMMYVGGKISSETRLPFELMETQIIIVSSDFSKSPAFGEFAKVIQSQTLSKKFLDSLLPH